MGDMAAKDMASKGFSIALAGRTVDDAIVVKSSENKRKYFCTVSAVDDDNNDDLLKLFHAEF